MTSGPYAEVIGDPIAYSKSPIIHNFWLRQVGLKGEYRRRKVTSTELGAYFAERLADAEFRGCNITMPHKLAALEFVHKHRDPSFPIEPINTAVPVRGRLEGLNSDTNGILEPLTARVGPIWADGVNGRGAATVIGAGGVLHPVLIALSILGFGPITVMARDPDRLEDVQQAYRGLNVRTLALGKPLPSSTLLVNASPLGMHGFPPFPYAANDLPEGCVVFDLIYAPVETALLRSARARGLETIDGLEMLVAQAAVGFKAFFGQPAPREHDAALRALLTA